MVLFAELIILQNASYLCFFLPPKTACPQLRATHARGHKKSFLALIQTSSNTFLALAETAAVIFFLCGVTNDDEPLLTGAL